MTTTSSVRVAPITGRHPLKCPYCGDVRSNVTTSGTEGSYLYDGDTVFGVWQRLTDEQRNSGPFDYGLMVGRCPSCDSRYFVIQASFANSMSRENEGEFDHLTECLRYNLPIEHRHNLLCALTAPIPGVPDRWYVEEQWDERYETILHFHVFGPFPLDNPDEVEGPNGVSACSGSDDGPWEYGRNLLLNTWDVLRAFNRQGETTLAHK